MLADLLSDLIESRMAMERSQRDPLAEHLGEQLVFGHFPSDYLLLAFYIGTVLADSWKDHTLVAHFLNALASGLRDLRMSE